MEDINVNELCNEAGKMRKFFKAFSQIDEVLIAVQNSDVVLKQLKAQIAEKKKELDQANETLTSTRSAFASLASQLASAKENAEVQKSAIQATVKDSERQASEAIKKAKDDADKEIMEIRASVKSERRAGEEVIKGLKLKQVEAQKANEAVMEGLIAEEAKLQTKIQLSREILETLKAKLSM